MYLNDPSDALELSFAGTSARYAPTVSEREACAAEPQGVTQGETQTDQEQPGPSGAAEAQAEAEMPSETQVNENAETQIEEETDARGETVAPPTAQEEVESEGAAEG
ncbi:hypothetical protein WMY93_014108 [Mugilogobius chulae]|uniref:Uncharacterized protein n=1 Tax=Mugilogobius chulae TaxID=88201 RepID=A0AAW0NW24_9GOBI